MRKSITRRALFSALLATLVGLAAPVALAQTPKVIKISHQFPAATIDEGDFRDRLVRRFAADVEKHTNGAVKFEIYPGGSLMKTNSQFGALRKGALDMSLVPLAYGGGEVPEVNLTLMPALVTELRAGPALEDGADRQGADRDPRRQEHHDRDLDLAGRRHCPTKRTVVKPDDAKGMKIRGGSKEMDLMLKGAGGAVTNCRRRKSTARCSPACSMLP